VPFTEDFHKSLSETDFVVDAIFGEFTGSEQQGKRASKCLWADILMSNQQKGFSFSGEIREPFPAIIKALSATAVPVLAVDAPSSWDIQSGPPDSGPGQNFHPTALISLTAPKPLVEKFKGRHFLGGR
jgi:NAD(P)H-hydrate epimerase